MENPDLFTLLDALAALTDAQDAAASEVRPGGPDGARSPFGVPDPSGFHPAREKSAPQGKDTGGRRSPDAAFAVPRYDGLAKRASPDGIGTEGTGHASERDAGPGNGAGSVNHGKGSENGAGMSEGDAPDRPSSAALDAFLSRHDAAARKARGK